MRQTIAANVPSVLVVDDDPAIRDLLELVLSIEGYVVRTASNGAEALDVLERCSVGLILLDLMMPVMDGWTFRSRQLQMQRASAIPVVVLSAGAAVRRHAEVLGAASMLEKPFDLNVLLATVSGLVSSNDPE